MISAPDYVCIHVKMHLILIITHWKSKQNINCIYNILWILSIMNLKKRLSHSYGFVVWRCCLENINKGNIKSSLLFDKVGNCSEHFRNSVLYLDSLVLTSLCEDSLPKTWPEAAERYWSSDLRDMWQFQPASRPIFSANTWNSQSQC